MGDQPEGRNASAIGRGLLAPLAAILAFFLVPYVLHAAHPQFSPGLVVCLRIAASFAAFIAVNAVTREWREDDIEPEGARLSRVIVGILSAIGLTLFFTAAYIDGNAQPEPDRFHTVPLHEKGGTISYLTPEQSRIEQIANWGFFGSLAAGFAFAHYLQRTQRK
jgi:hypothetical protein